MTDQAESILQFATQLVLAPSHSADPDEDPSLLKTQALLTISYLLATLPAPLPLSEDVLGVFAYAELWDLTRASEPAGLRRALYEVLGAAAARSEAELVGGDVTRTVAERVLVNCWSEDEGWAGVIGFLRRYPEAWTLADESLAEHGTHPIPEERSDDESDDQDKPSTSAVPTSSLFTPSPVLSLLLTHLTLACSARPANYPTILLLLSTLPPSILPPTLPALSLLLESFWAAWGGRALSVGTLASSGAGPSPAEEFVASVLECLLWEAAKAEQSGKPEWSQALVDEWVGRVWKTFVGRGEDGSKRHRGIATRGVANQLEATLAKLAAKSDAVVDGPWAVVEDSSLAVFGSEDGASASLAALAVGLTVLNGSKSEAIRTRGHTLARRAVLAAATGIAQDSAGASSADLFTFIRTVREDVTDDAEVTATLNELATTQVPILLGQSSSQAPLSFLSDQLTTASPESRAAIWTSLFRTEPSPEVLLSLIEAVSFGSLPADLPSANLDDLVRTSASRAFSAPEGSARDLQIVQHLMIQPQPFIQAATVAELLSAACTVLIEQAGRALASSSVPNLDLLVAPARLLAGFVQLPSNAERVMAVAGAAQAVFEVAHVLPNCRLEQDGLYLPVEATSAAEQAWSVLLNAGGERLVGETLETLTKFVTNTTIRPSPVELATVASALLESAPTSSLSLANFVISEDGFTSLRTRVNLNPPSPSLAIGSPLVSQAEEEDDSAKAYPDADGAGLTSYARAVLALLDVAARDTRWVRRNMWVLPHVLLVADVARDELAVAGSTTSVFGKGAPEEVLSRVVAAADGLGSYVLSAVSNELPEGWHQAAVLHLRAKEAPPTAPDALTAVLDGLARRGRVQEEVYARRAFLTVLQATLRYTEGTVVDAERWLAWGQNLAEGMDLTCAVLLAIKSTLLETPRYERYQNELASVLSGVAPSAANQRGLGLLRVLLASAPPPDAPVIFLPQRRAMFLIQQVQAWIASDSDLADEVHSLVAELFVHLAPIVQDMSGSHWDLVFDIVESNLETASWDEEATLGALYHSCRLLGLVKDLAGANAELRATVKARVDTSLELVRDLFVSRPTSAVRHAPRLQILEAMARLMRDLPPKLLAMGGPFDQLLRLLQDPSTAVQQSAYDLVCRIATKHVSDLVVEVELESDAAPEAIELPAELVKLLARRLPGDALEREGEFAGASSFLLAWLTAFRFFEFASPRIKAGYIDQLRTEDLVAASLLPSLFGLLSLTDRTRAFDIAPWAVEEFHFELVDELTAGTLPVLAAHVYYRALQTVPSLIRSYWEAVKNRQLSLAISAFTSKHLSPVLIANELAHLRDPNDPTAQALSDNADFVVKVAGGANEVKAQFTVDEQTMEIGIRLPSDYPLAAVEVKDVRKVGVTEAQWRAWLLAVQQVVTSQNGLIADALNLFKKNVALHFEGVEACAICYSVISVVDRSLPTKACRTCNNRFHAGCLFKVSRVDPSPNDLLSDADCFPFLRLQWFSTSHGSSCPLCRSLF